MFLGGRGLWRVWNHSLFCRGTPNKLTLPKVKSLFRSLREAREGAKSWDTENYSTVTHS